MDCVLLKYSPDNLVLGKMLSIERKVARRHECKTQFGSADLAGISCLTGLPSVCDTIWSEPARGFSLLCIRKFGAQKSPLFEAKVSSDA